MKKIGLTGNIGSGKTTVSNVFKTLGVPIFYADDEAKRLMVEDESLRLQELFSESSLRLRKVPESEIFPFDPQLLSFMNVNSPTDLEFARKMIEPSE